MGRYYSGDIEGKFWFACQSSNDADHFGVIGTPPDDRLNYHFSKGDMPSVQKGIDLCMESLKLFSPNLPSLLDAYYYHDGLPSNKEEWELMSTDPQPQAIKIPHSDGENITYRYDILDDQSCRDFLRQHSIVLTDAEMSNTTQEYARLILGRKIYLCLVNNGECFFEAEL
jgi:hypothetical protein